MVENGTIHIISSVIAKQQEFFEEAALFVLEKKKQFSRFRQKSLKAEYFRYPQRNKYDICFQSEALKGNFRAVFNVAKYDANKMVKELKIPISFAFAYASI